MSDNTNDTYIVDDGAGPELWLRTEGNKQDQLLLTKDELRAKVWHHMPLGAPYLDEVDRLWDAIAATAGEAPKDDAEPTPEQVEAEPACNCDYGLVWPDGVGHESYCATLGGPVEPEQVEAASAPDWARLAASNAEADAIEALVTEYHEYSHGYVTNGDLRTFAARVLEVGGQQPGVPVEKVRAIVATLRRDANKVTDGIPMSALALGNRADDLAELLPKEPTS